MFHHRRCCFLGELTSCHLCSRPESPLGNFTRYHRQQLFEASRRKIGTQGLGLRPHHLIGWFCCREISEMEHLKTHAINRTNLSGLLRCHWYWYLGCLFGLFDLLGLFGWICHWAGAARAPHCFAMLWSINEIIMKFKPIGSMWLVYLPTFGCWVVVWNIFYFHPENWGSFHFWLIFFKWVETTNQVAFYGKWLAKYTIHPWILWEKSSRGCFRLVLQSLVVSFWKSPNPHGQHTARPNQRNWLAYEQL